MQTVIVSTDQEYFIIYYCKKREMIYSKTVFYDTPEYDFIRDLESTRIKSVFKKNYVMNDFGIDISFIYKSKRLFFNLRDNTRKGLLETEKLTPKYCFESIFRGVSHIQQIQNDPSSIKSNELSLQEVTKKLGFIVKFLTENEKYDKPQNIEESDHCEKFTVSPIRNDWRNNELTNLTYNCVMKMLS